MIVAVSKTEVEPVHCPLGKPHFSSFFSGSCVLIGLEFWVVVWELVEENGYGQTIEDDSKGDADESKDTTQDGLRVNISIADSGDTDLQWWLKKKNMNNRPNLKTLLHSFVDILADAFNYYFFVEQSREQWKMWRDTEK